MVKSLSSLAPRIGLLFGAALYLVLRSNGELTWSELTPTTDAVPSARARPALAYDYEDDVLLLFGGVSEDGNLDDTWIFDFSSQSWSSLTVSNPPGARFDAIGGYFNGEFIIATGEGGSGGNRVFYNDIWSLNFKATSPEWRQLDSDSNTKPSKRYGAAGGLLRTTDKNDENYGKFYISHGFSDIRYSDTFVFDLNSTGSTNTGWKEVFSGTTAYSSDLPHPRCLVATTTNDKGFLMFGGCLSSGQAGGPCPAPDSWYFKGSDKSWLRHDDLQIPSSNGDMCMYWGDNTYDDDNTRYGILYGGDQTLKATQKISGTEINGKAVHFIDINSGKWSSYDGVNGPDYSVYQHRMVSIDDGCIVFGGRKGSGSSSNDYLNIMYKLSGTIEGLSTNGVEYTYFSVLYLHGIFMWISWGVLLQIGGFMAHFGRKLKREGYWFKPWHVYCQRIGYFFNLIGIICGFLGLGSPIFAHGIIGILIFIFATIQVISGECRPHNPPAGQPKSSKRKCFEIFHKMTNGRILLIVSLINISLGVYLILAPVVVQVIWFVQLGLIVVLYIVFELDKRNIIQCKCWRDLEYNKKNDDSNSGKNVELNQSQVQADSYVLMENN